MFGQQQVPRALPQVPAASQGASLPLERLLERAGGGDRQAFALVYDATASQAFGIALRLTCDQRHAEDAVHAAYRDLWRRGASFDRSTGSGLGWILMIVHTETVKSMRAQRSRRKHLGTVSGRQPNHDLPESGLVLTSPAGRRVQKAFDRMPAGQREMVQWAYFDGYTHSQIDQLVGIPAGTAQIAIRDGLIALRDASTA